MVRPGDGFGENAEDYTGTKISSSNGSSCVKQPEVCRDMYGGNLWPHASLFLAPFCYPLMTEDNQLVMMHKITQKN
jgi:hypothetical protein